MEPVAWVKRWNEAISLSLLCIVWASLQWNALRGLVTDGPAVLETPYDVALLVLLLLTVGALGFEIRQTVAN